MYSLLLLAPLFDDDELDVPPLLDADFSLTLVLCDSDIGATLKSKFCVYGGVGCVGVFGGESSLTCRVFSLSITALKEPLRTLFIALLPDAFNASNPDDDESTSSIVWTKVGNLVWILQLIMNVNFE